MTICQVICVPGLLYWKSNKIWDFSNIYLFPKILSLKLFRNLRDSSYTRFIILKAKFFYLWGIRPVLKLCEYPKCYDEDCLTVFLFLSLLSMTTQVLGKVFICLKKVGFFKRRLTSNVEWVSKNRFWPKTNMQRVLTQAIKSGTLMKMSCLIILSERGEKLCSYGKCYKIEGCAKLSSYDQKFVCWDHPGQTTWNKVKKFIKIGQD